MMWHSRRWKRVAYLYLADCTSAYDTVSHRAMSTASVVYSMPYDVERKVLAHVSGHSRVINTAYGLGNVDEAAELDGGLAQGAIKSPGDYVQVTTVAHDYANSWLAGYRLDAADEAGSVMGGGPTARLAAYANEDLDADGQPVPLDDDGRPVPRAELEPKRPKRR